MSKQESTEKQLEHKEQNKDILETEEDGIPKVVNADPTRLLKGFGAPHDHSMHDHHHHDNLNLRAAIVHLIGDLLQSIGVIIASVIIYFFPSYKIIDPICTYVFSIIVLFTTMNVFKECYLILMEATPNGVRTDHIREDVMGIRGVESIDDFHCWALAGGKNFLTIHIKLKEIKDSEAYNHRNDVKRVYKRAMQIVKEHDICHATI